MGVNPLALLDGHMTFEGVGVHSLWNYNETTESFNQSLLEKTMEFQSFQMNAREELKEYTEQNSRLHHLLKQTIHERDEERQKVQILLNKVDQLQFKLQKFIPETKANSGTAESGSLSPVESFLDAHTGDSRHIGAPQQPIFAEFYNSSNSGMSYDEARLDQLIVNRALPEKGKLLEAVMAAGPLLQNLMVAGALPRWRNPPPLQPLQLPPISVKGLSSQILNQTALLSSHTLAQGSSSAFHNQSVSDLCMMKRSMDLTCVSSFPCLSAKRLKSQ